MNKIVQHLIDDMNLRVHILRPDAVSYVDKNPLHLDYEKTRKDLYTWFETQVIINGGIFTELDYRDYEINRQTGEWEEHNFYNKTSVDCWVFSSYGWDDPLNQIMWEKRKVFDWAEPVWCIVLPPPKKLKDAKTYKDYLIDLYANHLQKLSIEEKRLTQKLHETIEATEEELIESELV